MELTHAKLRTGTKLKKSFPCPPNTPSTFQSILPLEVEVQTLDVARSFGRDTVPLARRALLPLDSFAWATV
jgi:hypothetical protein